MAEGIPIFFGPHMFDEPRTGGELYYKYLKDFLQNREEVQIILPDERDNEIITQPSGILSINWWFLRRFVTLPRDSVIIEDQMFRFAYFLANWIMKLCRKDIRILAMAHETPYQKYGGMDKFKNKMITYLFYRSSDCIIVNSKYIGREVASLGGPTNKIRIRLYPGQQFIIKTTSKKGNNTVAKILCVANIRPKKGQKYLIEALRLLDGQKLKVLFAGICKDKDYERELLSLIQEYGLEDRVKILGWLDGKKLAKAYQEADIFVLPSLYEPLGMVIQEAMQFGLPIVASNTGGIPEQVTNLEEALLVPPGDPRALAGGIERLLTDTDLRQRFVKNAYQRLKDRPTWDEVLEHDMSLILCSAHPHI